MNHLIRDPEGERGAVAIIVTICLILLFLLVGLTIDLGMARADVRDNQSISDFASIAAVNTIRNGGGYVDACHAAVDYFFANAEGLSLGSSEHTTESSKCSGFAVLDSGCVDETEDPIGNPLTEPVPVTVTAGPYTVTIVSPVLDNDPTMTVEGQAKNPGLDGEACDRVKVTVVRERDYIFGPVAGIVSGRPAADSVGVYFEEPQPNDIASLIVLEQVACNALTADGTNAGFLVVDNTVDGTLYPGRITVDSAGTGGSGSSDCTTGTRYTINPSTGTICAQGDVGSHALGGGDAARSHPPATGTADCLPSGLGGAEATGLGVTVFPREARYGRSSVDWLVNCQATYGDYNDPGNQRYPFYGDTPACPSPPDGSDPLPPFLDRLRAELQSGVLTPADGWTVINDCDGDLTNTAAETKIHVTCVPDSATNSIVFTGVSHVVFDHPVPQQVTELTITGSEDLGAVVYFRTEGIRRTASGSSTTFENVFVYVDTRDGLGVETTGGNVEWNSVKRKFVDGEPVLDAVNCSVVEGALPTAACFAPLALWSNSTSDHSFGGNGVQEIAGSYFIPNAHVILAGSGTATFTDAQFFGRTMVAGGNGTVTLSPNPESNIQPPLFNFGLIR